MTSAISPIEPADDWASAALWGLGGVAVGTALVVAFRRRPGSATERGPDVAPLFPLPESSQPVRAISFSQGRPFGSKDPERAHMGIDVRARYLDAVRMPEAGTIVGIQGWRGELTRGVLAQLDRGPLVVFGALHPEHLPEVGRHYLRGEMIGRIGEYPHGSHMLHFELWRGSTRGHWAWGAPRPEDLIDPTAYLQSALRDGARAA